MAAFQLPDSLIHALGDAQRVAALTGAGISAESGVPTFREAQTGLWARYNPEELATPEAFQRDPKLVWDWYTWRRTLVAKAEPNPGHRALVELEQHIPFFTLITQNVDGLHRRAGSRQVVELHGDLFRSKCFRCDLQIASPEALEETSPVPCPQCKSWLRPDVVWFGEMLPPEALEAAEQAASQCQIFFSIGTSALVYPAAGIPLTALHRGATLVEINPQSTPLSQYAHFVLRGTAAEVLPHLVTCTWQ